MKITLKSGRAHQKHTEGGDFRQATYRALRQGLMQAESVLLEPYQDFVLEVPREAVGRAMTDLDKRYGKFTLEQEGEWAVLKGTAPMAALQDYHKEIAAYTRGMGRFSVSFKGYFPCHNTEEILEEKHYDPQRDVDNPAGSVFCAHGAGFIVEWDKVPDYMHLESCLCKKEDAKTGGEEALVEGLFTVKGGQRSRERGGKAGERPLMAQDEVEAILKRTFHANKKEEASSRPRWGKGRGKDETRPYGERQQRVYEPAPKKDAYLLVDGYNVIFAWEELKELAERNLDGARGRLLDLLCNYQAVKGCSLIAVFDAYRLVGHPTEVLDYHNIHVVFTKEAETADQYIEKFAHENGRKYDVTVATSDGLEQVIIVGEGCKLISSRELKEEIGQLSTQAVQDFQRNNPGQGNSLGNVLPKKAAQEMDEFKRNFREAPHHRPQNT